MVFAAPGDVLYVDRSSAACSDAGLGTPGQPYCTIGAAAAAATAGMSVVVSAGTYPENVSVMNSGLQGAPISFAPISGASVTISGLVHGFTVTGKSWIIISGFNITHTSSDGILLRSASHITIDGVHASYAGQPISGQTGAGIYLNATTDSLIQNSTADNNTYSGIGLYSGSVRNEVRRNLTFANARKYTRASPGIDVQSAYNTIDLNITHDNEDSGIQFYPGGDYGIAFANVTYNNGDHGIDDLNVVGGVLTGNTIFHNCTAGINVEGTSGNYTITNNISVDNAVYPAYNGLSCERRGGNIGIWDSAPASTTVDYNLVYLTASGALYKWAGTTYSSPAALRLATGQEAHGVQADPRWVSSASANFHLQGGSPAIDSANSGAPSEPLTDVEGSQRLDDPATTNSGAGPRLYDDRGAYEFQGALPDTQPPSVPANLGGTSPSQNSVSLTWTASTDNVGVSGYTVYRNGTQLATIATPRFTDTSVTPSTTYSYAIDAFDAAGNHSASSTPVSVTSQPPDTQPPTVPTELSAPAAGANSISLAWNAATDNVGVTGYTVYRNGVGAATSPTNTFIDTGLSPTTTYSYAVDAFDAAGNHSAASAAITATTVSKPVSYVQSASISTGGRFTSTTLTLRAAVGSGDLLTGLFAQWDAAGQVQVSDNVNGAWTRANSITYSTGKGDIALYYVANSRPSATGITITITAGGSTYLRGAAAEYSGVALISPLDQVAMRSGSGVAVDSGATASVAAGELVFAAMTANSNPGTITGGVSQGLTFVMRSAYSSTGDADILSGSAGAQNARFNIATSVTWYALAAVFKSNTADSSPPSVPAGVSATAGSGGVSVSWNASTDSGGVTGYSVYRDGALLSTVAGTVLAYSDSSVTAGSTYSYTVDAFDAAGNHSARSAAATATVPSDADTISPSAPANLSAQLGPPGEIDLSWSASTDNIAVTGYTVYRNGSPLGSTAAGTLSYADVGLGHGFTYTYTVTASDAAGNASAQSTPASATTIDDVAPTTPGGFGASPTSPTTIAVSWSASSDNVGVTGYDVFRDGVQLVTVGGSQLSYSDTVTGGSSHSYTVDAFDAAGNHSGTPTAITVTTATADSTPPSTPTGINASASGPAQVLVAWNASTDDIGVTGYTIYRNGSPAGTVSGSTLGYTDNAVTPATNYSYTVDAFDGSGNHSAQSAPASVHVPGRPAFVQSKAVTSGARLTTITIAFGAVAQGDLLVGWFGQYDSAGQVGVSDNVNGAWTRSASTTWNGSAGDIALYYLANSAAAPTGLTITITASAATYLQGGAAEYSGVAAVNPLDKVVIAKGTGTSADSGLTAATGSGELVFGGMTTTNGAGTLVPGNSQGAGFVKRTQSSAGSQGVEDILSSNAGQQHAGFTFTNSVPWFMVCAVFKPA